MLQPTRECVAKLLKRLGEKIQGRVIVTFFVLLLDSCDIFLVVAGNVTTNYALHDLINQIYQSTDERERSI